MAPGLLHEPAVVSAMARGMTARASAAASPRAAAAQVTKVVEGTLAASTPHSCSSADTSWQAYDWLGAGAGAVEGAGRVAAGVAAGVVTPGVVTGEVIAGVATGVTVGVATGVATLYGEGVGEGDEVAIGEAAWVTLGVAVAVGSAVGVGGRSSLLGTPLS